MVPAPAIGIDLGTTFSGAAVYRKGKTEIIPNKEGGHLTPSFVFYDPRSLNVSVGSTADDKGVKRIDNFLFDIKRIIGRKYDDVYIQELKKLPEYKFDIVRGENDMAVVKLTHDNVLVEKTPEQASSELLKYLRESANEFLGTEVTEAVISIPAHFSNAQRKATRTAAELAGFKVLKLISEPVAAAIHYAEDRLETAGTLLVVDFGGGTLDVSIIEVDKRKFEVKSVEGETFLGGRNFDQILLQHFKADIIRKFGSEIFTDRLLRRVKEACTRLKIKLSTEQEYSLTINCFGGEEDKDYSLGMSRLKFEQLSEDLCNRMINLVKKCITEAGMSKSDINEVVLVGGSTRIPKVRDMLSSYFNNKKLKTDLNPDEAVALGAAVQAAMIKEKFRDLEKYKITEITPLSLGMDLMGGYMKVCINKNSPVPFKSKPIGCCTSENNQEIACFKIFEGERKNCKYNNFLGSLTINNLPPGKAGKVSFETIFTLNEDGILEVEAYESSTKEGKKLAVTIGQYRLCEYKIKNLIYDAEQNKQEDDMFEEFIKLRTNYYEKCNHILYDIGKVPSATDRGFVKAKCEEFKRYSKSLDYTKIDNLRKEYSAFTKVVKGIIENYIDVDLNERGELNDLSSSSGLVSLMTDTLISINSLTSFHGSYKN